MTWIVCVVFWAAVFRLSAGFAQTAAPITSSGINTQVNLSTAPSAGEVQYDITGGTRAGENLFHSFGDFNVPNGNIANFLNDSGLATSNILGRVNGGHASNIFGTLQTTGFGNANLFLMNPAGIVFGPTASLNVGGSVTFTTANYLRLDKVGGPHSGLFHTDPTRVSLLTSAPVDAFGFLGANPSSITVQGSQLTVPKEHGISLIGGNIAIQYGTLGNGAAQAAHLSASNGQINLAITRSPGEFLQNLTAAPNINDASFTSFASVHLEPGSIVDLSHTSNGKVSIRGGQLTLEIQNTVLDTATSSSPSALASNQDTIVLAPKSLIISQTSSLDPSPDISISADRITIVGVPGSKENIFEKPLTGMESTTNGAGKAGDITLRATGDLALTKVVSLQSFAMPQSTGTAGNINLISTKGNILMKEGAAESQVLSLAHPNSSGNTGTVTASATEGDIVLDGGNFFTQSQGSGRAGSIEITAKNLSMRSGLLSIENFFSTHKPGGITVTLSGKLTMTTDPSLDVPDFFFPNSLIATSAFSPTTEAPAGDITLTVKDIVATDGSLITSETFASGAGGQLKIFADTLQLRGGSRIKSGSTIAPPVGELPESITPTGAGGDVTIALAPNGSIVIDGQGSGIFSDTQGTGAGGTITLSARALTVQNGGALSTETSGTSSQAIGGSIAITASDRITLTKDGSITASTTGSGDAGNILIKSNNVSVTGGAKITAESTGTGQAGTVVIQGLHSPAKSFLLDGVGSSILTSTAKTGMGGNILINADNVLLRNGGTISAETSGNTPSATGGTITIKGDHVRIEKGALVTASTTGAGNGGTITIQAAETFQSKGGIVHSTATQAQGGNITITAGQSMHLTAEAEISTLSKGPGNAGNIFLNGGQQFEMRDSRITATAQEASGGNIDLVAHDQIRLVNSQMNASVQGGPGTTGGNISIDPKIVVLQNSQILAKAVAGSGGNITITTPLFLSDRFSLVDASSQFGLNGRVMIQSPTSNLSGTVGQLTSKPTPMQLLVHNRCAALAGGQESTFFLGGRTTWSTEPGGWINSPNTMVMETGEVLGVRSEEHKSTIRVSTASENAVLSLRRLTPAGFLVRSFALDGSTGCRS